jgi:hypothetical protein
MSPPGSGSDHVKVQNTLSCLFQRVCFQALANRFHCPNRACKRRLFPTACRTAPGESSRQGRQCQSCSVHNAFCPTAMVRSQAILRSRPHFMSPGLANLLSSSAHANELFPALLAGAFSEPAQDRHGGRNEIDPVHVVELARPPEKLPLRRRESRPLAGEHDPVSGGPRRKRTPHDRRNCGADVKCRRHGKRGQIYFLRCKV